MYPSVSRLRSYRKTEIAVTALIFSLAGECVFIHGSSSLRPTKARGEEQCRRQQHKRQLINNVHRGRGVGPKGRREVAWI